MVGRHHQFNGYEFEQTLRESERQESLMCCSPWARRVGHNLATEQQPGDVLPSVVHRSLAYKSPGSLLNADS